MKALKVVVAIMTSLIMLSYPAESFARSVSIATQATIVILPRSDSAPNSVYSNEGQAMPTQQQIDDVGLISRFERIATSDGNRSIETVTPVL